MDIKIKNTLTRIPFADVDIGQLFTDENGQGLFVKIKPFASANCYQHKAVAIIIKSVEKEGVPSGETTGWLDTDLVVPAKGITIELLQEE